MRGHPQPRQRGTSRIDGLSRDVVGARRRPGSNRPPASARGAGDGSAASRTVTSAPTMAPPSIDDGAGDREILRGWIGKEPRIYRPAR